MHVHERLLLLMLDDEKGTCRTTYADTALAGAVLVDLLDAGVIAADADGVQALAPDTAPPGALRDAAALIAGEQRTRSLRWWVDHLAGRMKPLQIRLAAGLVERGVLRQEEHKLFGLFPRTRLPELDPAPESQVVHRLRAVLLGAQPADRGEAALAALVGVVDLVGAVVDKPDRKRATQRATEIAAGDEVSDAVRAAVKAAQAAVMVAVIAATTTTT